MLLGLSIVYIVANGKFLNQFFLQCIMLPEWIHACRWAHPWDTIVGLLLSQTGRLGYADWHWI